MSCLLGLGIILILMKVLVQLVVSYGVGFTHFFTIIITPFELELCALL